MDDFHNESASHTLDLPRVNRITGQMTGVKKMIEEHRDCPDILTQLRAIRSAIKGLEASILDRHLNHCIVESMSAGDENDIKNRIQELKNLFRRYDD